MWICTDIVCKFIVDCIEGTGTIDDYTGDYWSTKVDSLLKLYWCLHNEKRKCSYGYIWHFQLYLHISPRVQTMIKVKPSGVGVICLASDPQVKVANASIQLLRDGLLLYHKPLQQSNKHSHLYFLYAQMQSVLTGLNSIYLSGRPCVHYFTCTIDLAESFQCIRLYYRGVDVQVITHWVMAT